MKKEENFVKKIPTLFKRVFDGQRIADVLPDITEGCEEALLHGKATLKWDGSCCAVINGELYRRYDAKKGKPVPKGAVRCQEEPDPITGHFPCWVKCDRNNPADKWFFKAFDNTPDKKDGTYEAVGVHFQGNPYGLCDDILEPHGDKKIDVTRSFNEIKKYLEINNIEGIVFWLDGKPVCKIKRTDFGYEWNGKGGNNGQN